MVPLGCRSNELRLRVRTSRSPLRPLSLGVLLGLARRLAPLGSSDCKDGIEISVARREAHDVLIDVAYHVAGVLQSGYVRLSLQVAAWSTAP